MSLAEQIAEKYEETMRPCNCNIPDAIREAFKLAAQEAERVDPIIQLCKLDGWRKLTQDEAAVKVSMDIAARIRRMGEG